MSDDDNNFFTTTFPSSSNYNALVFFEMSRLKSYVQVSLHTSTNV